MTLAELIQEVYVLTRRPDLVDSTASAVRAATLKLHQLDFWYKDILEKGISFSAAGYYQQFQYRTLIPLWRSIKYLRKYDATFSSPGNFFTLVAPKQVVDGSGLSREDIFYVAGDEVDIRSSTSFQYALLGCYVNPDVTTGGFNSWIALDHPYAIVYEAASRVFKGMGKDDEAGLYKQELAEQIAAISADSIQPEGY
jgi:hypothetical protein